MSLYLMIAVILLCLVLEALYSGGEVALFSSDINKIKYYARQGSSGARQAVKLKEHPEWFISTALIGTKSGHYCRVHAGHGSFDSIFWRQAR